MGFPRYSTRSPGMIRMAPRSAVRPLTVTCPEMISASAPRREQTPDVLRNLVRLSDASSMDPAVSCSEV